MKKTISITFVFVLLITGTSFSQYSQTEDTRNLYNVTGNVADITKTPLKGALGVNAGLAFIESNTGIAVGVFAEIEAGSFAFVPQANYWQVKKQSNFELSGLARLKFASQSLEPYVDGGIGINFYNNNENNADLSFQKLGVIVGGGIELKTVSNNFTLLVDGKYKIIINNDLPGNISGYVITAGLKFPF